MGNCASTRANQYYAQILKILENSVLDNDADALDTFLRESILTSEEIDDICLLHHAAQMGFPDSIRVLLDTGASVNATDNKEGMTPLHYAAVNEQGVSRCVPLIVKAGAEINSMGDKICGKTALHIAIEKGYLTSVNVLLEYGCNPNTISECSQGISPLLLAIKEQKPGILEALLRGGADIRKCWIHVSCQTPPLDVLTHQMTSEHCDRDLCMQMLATLIQADGDLVTTLCQMPKGLQTKVKSIRTFEALQTLLFRLKSQYPKQAQTLLMSLVCSGYKPRGEALDFLQSYDAAIFEVIRKYVRRCPSLKDLCVRKVRKAVRFNVMHGVSRLPQLSSAVKDVILIRNPPEPCLINLD